MPTSYTLSVVICAYTEERWHELIVAVESVQRQTLPPTDIILVIDHNRPLLERAAHQFDGIVVLENSGPQGLSGARNSGIAMAHGDIIAFLDDDAIAAPDWLAHLVAGYHDPQVIGVGGAIDPLWQSSRPDWLPNEFDWVVGCTYRGMPEQNTTVRNLIGCNMSFRREVFEQIGGFNNGVGQVGAGMLRCDDTEFCIRVRQHWPERTFLYMPQARVRHQVHPNRTRWSYFRTRCFTEGIAKATISRLLGSKDGLSSERSYTMRTLPLGVGRGIMDSLMQHDSSGLARSGSIIAGLSLATAGFVWGSLVSRLSTTHVAQPQSPPVGAPPATITMQKTRSFTPMRVITVDIGRPLPNITPHHPEPGRIYRRALILVRLHDQPVGTIELDLPWPALPAVELAHAIWQELHTEINNGLKRMGLAAVSTLSSTGIPASITPAPLLARQCFLAHAPFVTVIIPTRDRSTEILDNCLRSLLNMDYPAFEVIVVDNAPKTSVTQDFLAQRYPDHSIIRYVREDHPGQSWARNRGVVDARGEIVVYTDDDVVVDRFWLAELIKGFTLTDRVACVTGFVMPMELETHAQALFEQSGGFSKSGLERRIYDLDTHRPTEPPLSLIYPFTSGLFGSGNNMAFRTDFLREIGGFETALGPGVYAFGEDLLTFFAVIARGYRLVYEPSAICYHKHREDYAGLCTQTFNYGTALTAYPTWILLNYPQHALALLWKVRHALAYLKSSQSLKNRKKSEDYPEELSSLERKGMLAGPWLYLRGIMRSRSHEKRFGKLNLHTPQRIPRPVPAVTTASVQEA